MRKPLACLALLVVFPCSASAQDHLVPDTSVFADQGGSYELKMQQVFEQAFDEGVILRSLVEPSFRKEYVVGVHVKDEKAEVFVLEPSSMISLTEEIEGCQDRIKYLKEEGREIPPDLAERLQQLQEKAPADHRQIKVTRTARPLPRELAEDIRKIWEVMLMDVRHPQKMDDLKDGTTYHFSAWIMGRGEISGHAHSPGVNSRAGRLTNLTGSLGNYARGKVDLDGLKIQIEQTRLKVNGRAESSPNAKK